jgi:hypothetical protein
MTQGIAPPNSPTPTHYQVALVLVRSSKDERLAYLTTKNSAGLLAADALIMIKVGEPIDAATPRCCKVLATVILMRPMRIFGVEVVR